MRSRSFTLAFALLFALSSAAGLAVGQLAALQKTGQVVMHSQRNTGYYVNSTTFTDLPGLRGHITLPKGGDLVVTVSIEGSMSQSSNPSFSIRALVNGTPVGLLARKIFAGASGTRSTTTSFLAKGLAPGLYAVRVQGYVNSGARAWVNRRSLVMRFASSDSPDLRFFEQEGTSLSRQGGGYIDIPGMAFNVNLPWKSKLIVTVMGEYFAYAAQKRIFVRALVDGQPTAPGDAIVASGGSQGGRSFTFATGPIPKGSRQIRIQWMTDDLASVLFPRVLVQAVNEEQQSHASLVAVAPPSGPLVSTSSSTYVTIPGSGGTIFVPTRSDVTLRFAAEGQFLGSTRCFVRALFDGQPVGPNEAIFSTAQSPNEIQSREAVFVVRNVERGWHNFAMTWARDAAMIGTAYLGDRSLTVTAIRGQRPLLVTALESNRPANYQYGGLYSNAVVEVRNSQRVFRSFVRDNLFRASRSVAGWFLEVSQDNLALVDAKTVGPKLKSLREDIYRQQPDPFTKMKHEALRNADAVVDYSLYDRNGDGKVTKDELYAIVVMYQDTTFGEVRSIPAIPTNDGVTLDYTGGIATVYTPNFQSNGELGVITHELAHLLIGAGDMYENDPSAPGPYSIMDRHGYFSHLDPVHKIHAGKWYPDRQIYSDQWMVLKPQSQGGIIYKLFDPASHPGEYFYVENRRKTGYDSALPSEGIALWHVDDTKLPNYRTAVAMVAANGLNNNHATYLFTGQPPPFSGANDVFDSSPVRNTRWFDNSTSGIGVWAIERLGNGDMRCFLDVPGDGFFLQPEARDVNLDWNGSVNVRLRVVNTGKSTQPYRVTATFPGSLSWPSQSFSLAGGQQRILTLRVTPSGIGQRNTLTLRVVNTANTSLNDTQTVMVQRKLRATGPATPGGTVSLILQNDTQGGLRYAMRAAFTSSPGIPVPGVGIVPLTPDTLFFAVPQLPGVFQNFNARLDLGGSAVARVVIPNDAGLRGLWFYFAYVTYDTAIRDVSNAVRITIL